MAEFWAAVVRLLTYPRSRKQGADWNQRWVHPSRPPSMIYLYQVDTTSQKFLHLYKQHHHLGPKCSNAQVCGETFHIPAMTAVRKYWNPKLLCPDKCAIPICQPSRLGWPVCYSTLWRLVCMQRSLFHFFSRGWGWGRQCLTRFPKCWH